MITDPTTSALVSAMWLSIAILAGGFARTRNRSAWNWFFATLILGPIAALLLVVWPPRETPAPQSAPAAAADRTAL